MKTSFFKEPNKWECINNLVGGGTSGKDDGTDMVYPDGVTPPTEEEIETAWAKMKEDYKAQEYARKREAEYPTIQECVHAILDDDLTALQEKRQAIKTKYPKS